jgi:tRNA nucleotidyltransferase (CCA-adding enzyme)
MQLILTHEQADFDAIASLLGAYLLQKDAYVLLPNSTNRNVQSFIHLYGSELPFLKASELPNENITSITLVDTQSLPTLKGMRKDTQVYVIDHHQQKENFPPAWHFEPVDSIACTTRFVENLQENNGQLSLIHATLLLLGIYEDSGSLTYANTTPRDVSAVAYLLEQGASLKIAGDFLNPPLSLEQRPVFEDLLNNLETFSIQDCSVIVSHADAPRLGDEVSSIAHKICDLLDPDALFIFVKTKEGIRLVARSITDQISVARIARHYHGGGHERASSALIKQDKANPDQLTGIIATFKDELAGYIEPAVTVSQIMSKKPLTIKLNTTARQAYQLMQHFGYEGYPVVDNNEVRGLLTRRAVDRALSHKMDLTAASLMEAGNVSVAPGDSLEKLQQVMVESGWGQVPVVDPHSGKVIGITTRTDLLKILAGRRKGAPESKNYSTEIESLLPPARLSLLKTISQSAGELQLPIFLVGGFARDLLLKKPSLDLDFVVEGDAILLAKKLSASYGGVIASHKKFGTAKWRLDLANPSLIDVLQKAGSQDIHSLPAGIDLISARTEFYEKPTALPIVKKSSIKLDLYRRDFTINTMAIRLDGKHFGELYDHWGGLNDLQNKKIRVLHSLSFVDDPTRMLRAVRFEQRFGFSLEKRTLDLLHEARSLLDQVSGDRLRHELDQILSEKQAIKMLARLAQLGLLEQIHPAIRWDENLAAQFQALMENPFPSLWKFPKKPDEFTRRVQAGYILLLSHLQPTDLDAICRRLRFKNALDQMLRKANDLLPALDQVTGLQPSQVTGWLGDCPPLVVYCLYLHSTNQKIREILDRYSSIWRWIKPKTNGAQLKDMGIEPGPRIGQILAALKSARIDGSVTTDADEAQLLEKLVHH